MLQGAEKSYIGEFADGISFDSNVVLLELLLDLIDAGGDVLGLRTDGAEDRTYQNGWILLDTQIDTFAAVTLDHVGNICQWCLSTLPVFNRNF